VSDTLPPPPPSPVANSNPWASLAQPDYFGGILAKLPPGAMDNGTILQALLGAGGANGLAQLLADVQAAASQLSEVETVPSSADVLLGYWEADYGLPDCCTPSGNTLQQRRNALLAKIAAQGGQSEAYFIAVAAALVWAITITEGSEGSHTWTINGAATAPGSIFTAGGSQAGDDLTTPGTNSELQCVMNRIKPAHTKLLFNFT
jgi:uncharacterized protein YmfQ (DUF2313 family)